MRGPLGVLLSAVLLAACAETEFVVHTAKRISQTREAPEPQGEYKVGSPYQIDGVWYYPKVDYAYDQTGIASWYGPNFHGLKTANGEIFDSDGLTAAHRTLPLPSYVRVTNLENGRSIDLKVNDRGPFAHGRIIDVSRRAARLLGFERQGTARVRVQVLAGQSRALAARLRGETQLAQVGSPITVSRLPKAAVKSETLPPPPGGAAAPPRPVPAGQGKKARPAAKPAAIETARASPEPVLGVVTTGAARATEIYIQVGAFAEFENAIRVRAMLSGVGEVRISRVLVGGQDLFRVRVGPMGRVEDADEALESVIRAGYANSRVIVD